MPKKSFLCTVNKKNDVEQLKNDTNMKKMMMTLIALLSFTATANAMTFEQARTEALFLTDKMAYELNLTDEQYEACYEINLDYLMGVTGRSDVFGTYWERRNLDMSYILYDWQWNAFIAASYFYRPLYWEAGYWHFGIYRRYPHRDYFYFGRPHFYATYRGGHAWHVHGTHGYYYGRRDHFRAPRTTHFGMHDRWTRGDFRNHRNSSTRMIGGEHNRRIERTHSNSMNRPNSGNYNRSNSGNFNRSNSGNFNRSNSGNFNRRENGSMNHLGNGSFNRHESGSMNRSSHSTTPSRNFSTPSRSSSSGSSQNRGSFSGSSHHSSSHSSGSFSGGSHGSSSHSGGSFSGGSHGSSGSHGGGSHSGGSLGGRR